LISAIYVGGLMVLVFYAGIHYEQVFDRLREWFS